MLLDLLCWFLKALVLVVELCRLLIEHQLLM
jgi:hypothetical protein